MWHPWRQLRERRHITLQWTDNDTGQLGCFNHRTQTITLDRLQTQAERRCTLTHELIHAERGPCPPGMAAREEEIVEREAARRLIDIRPLIEAMAWSTDMSEIAAELWVDEPMLRARLRSLHPAERALLHRRLSEVT